MTWQKLVHYNGLTRKAAVRSRKGNEYEVGIAKVPTERKAADAYENGEDVWLDVEFNGSKLPMAKKVKVGAWD